MTLLFVVSMCAALPFSGCLIDEEAFERGIALFKEALRLADISVEKACLYMKVDKAQFHRQLQQTGHISLTRMLLLPPDFWKWYALLLAEDFGLPKEVLKAAKVNRALRARKQLRMVPDVEAEQKTA